MSATQRWGALGNTEDAVATRSTGSRWPAQESLLKDVAEYVGGNRSALAAATGAAHSARESRTRRDVCPWHAVGEDDQRRGRHLAASQRGGSGQALPRLRSAPLARA